MSLTKEHRGLSTISTGGRITTTGMSFRPLMCTLPPSIIYILDPLTLCLHQVAIPAATPTSKMRRLERIGDILRSTSASTHILRFPTEILPARPKSTPPLRASPMMSRGERSDFYLPHIGLVSNFLSSQGVTTGGDFPAAKMSTIGARLSVSPRIFLFPYEIILI